MIHTPATASTQRLRLDCVAVSTLVLNGCQPSRRRGPTPAKIESAICQTCICALSLRSCVNKPESNLQHTTAPVDNAPGVNQRLEKRVRALPPEHADLRTVTFWDAQLPN